MSKDLCATPCWTAVVRVIFQRNTVRGVGRRLQLTRFCALAGIVIGICLQTHTFVQAHL